MARVRCKELVCTATAVGWNIKIGNMVFDEDVMLIGMSYAQCASALGSGEARLSKGVSDPAVDTDTDDCYFSILGHLDPAAGGGASQGFAMLPDGYFFPINEDEPIFVDLFATAIGDGGHVLVYYVKKREWSKKSF